MMSSPDRTPALPECIFLAVPVSVTACQSIEVPPFTVLAARVPLDGEFIYSALFLWMDISSLRLTFQNSEFHLLNVTETNFIPEHLSLFCVCVFC